jgi:tRNA modification GTPase
MLSRDHETIIALCTPTGSGAIALLRLSGSDAITIATSISKLASGKKLTDLPTHTIHNGWVVDNEGTQIDHVLFLLMHGPRTFTGQNTVEITCHNNPFVIENIITQALHNGARPAQQGEFTKRAVLQGKIDLIQAEAINELIHANTQLALKQSLGQLEGTFSHWISTIEKNLLKALVYCESSFEFLDEENIHFDGQIKQILEDITADIHNIKKTYSQQQQIRQGVRIALIGTVNTGKSSLFNALLNKERAIVTNIAGTTRDSIEAGLYKGGNYWTLIDTAGLRQTDDLIEKHGIERSRSEAELADIVILVVDSSRAMTPDEQEVYQELINKHGTKMIIVYNKMDLPQNEQHLITSDEQKVINLSSKTKKNIELLERSIDTKIQNLFQSLESPFLLNQRHYNLISELERKLNDVQQTLLTPPIAYELLSCHVRDMLESLSELSGKTISEQGLDLVFKEFCIGK